MRIARRDVAEKEKPATASRCGLGECCVSVVLSLYRLRPACGIQHMQAQVPANIRRRLYARGANIVK
jgi:hypothetical protein